MNLWARPLRVFVLILVGLIIGCRASRNPVMPPEPPMVLPLPTAARVMPDTNRPAPPPMEHGVISWTQTNVPPDTMGPVLFVVYKATNFLNPQWRYLTNTESSSVMASTTQSQRGFFKVESYRLALGVKIQPK